MALITLEEAKSRLKIPDIWLSLNLPGDFSKNPCHSPFYETISKQSFSISSDGNLFNDFRTGDRGDQITFLQLATGLSSKETCRKFLELAGGLHYAPLPVMKKTAIPLLSRELPLLPPMRHGTVAEHKSLAELRHVHIEAVKIADNVGLLRFGKWKGQSAWFVTEDGGRNAQARRMDGQRWERIEAKAQTLPGCWANWPLGIDLGDYPALCLVEGGPDLLAALHFIVLEGAAAAVAPVAMLGAAQKIHTNALPLFAGKRVRIYAHADMPGRNAAYHWKAQLEEIGCQVDAVDFSGLRKADGSQVADLNDCTQIHPDDAGKLEGLLPE